MDVILHLGAHRCASTSFQAYLRANAARLAVQGIGVWGPLRTRKGLFTGIIPADRGQTETRQFRQAAGRIALARERAARAGLRHLVVSDENILGAPRRNLRSTQLYAEAGMRLSRHVMAFGGDVARVVLSIRSPELYWASSFAFAVARGHPMPDAGRLAAIAGDARGWREVIEDIARAAPRAEVLVMTHEELGGLPERRLWHMTGERATPPLDHAREWLNRSPDLAALRKVLAERGEDPGLLPEGEGRWMPFDRPQQAALRERYSDDLFWLSAGAGGLATLVRERGRLAGQVGSHPPQAMERGHPDDEDKGRLVENR